MVSTVDLAQSSPFNSRRPTVALASPDSAQVAALISPTTADHSSPVDVGRLTDATSHDPVRLRRIVELYIHHTAERLEELESAIKLDSAGDVSAIAHKCLGSSETCGMIAIVPSLKALELLGNKGTLTGATNHLKSAQVAYASIKSFLEKYIETVTAVMEESCHV
jgi:HPt (histidine-containing phosphotransfer) domain-containing protein